METNLLTAIKEDAVDAVIINEDAPRKTSFIEANTEEVTLEHLKKDCIIPVFPFYLLRNYVLHHLHQLRVYRKIHHLIHSTPNYNSVTMK